MVKMVEVAGKKYPTRECYKPVPHKAHTHVTHMLKKPPVLIKAGKWEDNVWCEGTGHPPLMQRTKVPLKDYKADAENFPVSDPITVSQARKIALHMHQNDTDKSGRPYGEHLNAVEMGVRVLGGSQEERVAALFHDAVEDDHTSLKLLEGINVTPEALKIIEAVSKRSGEIQLAYLERVKKAGHGACRVKLADLMHNTRHDRIQALRDDKRGHTADRLLKKYRPYMAALMLELGLIVDEDEQKKFATKPQGSSQGVVYPSTYPVTNKSTPKTSTSKSTAKKSNQLWDLAKSHWAADSLFPGDWLVGWEAPIKEVLLNESADDHTFVLVTGQIKAIARRSGAKFPVVTYATWSQGGFTLPKGVSPEMFEAWRDGFKGMEDEVGLEDTWIPGTWGV